MTVGTQKEYAEHRGCSQAYISKIKREGRLVLTDDGLVDFEATDRLLAATSDPDKEGVKERWRQHRGAAAHPVDQGRSSAAGGAGESGDGGSTAVSDAALAAGVGPLAVDGAQWSDSPVRPDGTARNAAPGRTGSERSADPGPLAEMEAAKGETERSGGVSSALYDERLQAQVRILRLDEQKKQIELAEQAGKLILASAAQERMHAYGRQVRDLFLAMPARIQADLAAETDPNVVGRRLIDEIKATLHEFTRRMATQPGTD